MIQMNNWFRRLLLLCVICIASSLLVAQPINAQGRSTPMPPIIGPIAKLPTGKQLCPDRLHGLMLKVA
jgi:hypothetical protein